MPTKRRQPAGRSQPEPFHPERLAIDFVILSDACQVMGGKLYMLGGGWNLYHAQQYPLVFPFGVAIGILVPWSETNQRHPFEFVIRASEGNVLAEGRGQFEVGREAGLPPGMTQRVTVAVNGQLRLETPGTYEISVSIPGHEKQISFEALPVPDRR